MLDSSDTVTVTNNGIAVTMNNGMPKIYYKSDSVSVMTSFDDNVDDDYDDDVDDNIDDDYDDDVDDDYDYDVDDDGVESDHDRSK